MKRYQAAGFALLVASVLFSCKRTDDPTPEKEAPAFKVVITNEGEFQNFTQQMALIAGGTEVSEVQISGTEWDEVYDWDADGGTDPIRVFEKQQALPSTATYETNVDLRSLRYTTIVRAREATAAKMRMKVVFYHADERIGEKIYDIEGKGSAIDVTFHKDYNLFEQDIQQPLQ